LLLRKQLLPRHTPLISATGIFNLLLDSKISAGFMKSPHPVEVLFIQNSFCANYIQKTACNLSVVAMLPGHFKLALLRRG